MENIVQNLRFTSPNKNAQCRAIPEGVLFDNPTNKDVYFDAKKKGTWKGRYFKVKFAGDRFDHGNASLCIRNESGAITGSMPLNSEGRFFAGLATKYQWTVRVSPGSTVLITDICVEEGSEKEALHKDVLDGQNSKILIITPSYPSEANDYLCAFVHARVKGYLKQGLDFDLIQVNNLNATYKYDYDGVHVVSLPLIGMRLLLQKRHYEKVAIHFFGEEYAHVLDACDLHDTELFIWGHSVDFLYWDNDVIQARYFEKQVPVTQRNWEEYKRKDALIKRYNEMPNVKWVFVSDFIKSRSEELIGITYNNWVIIPNCVDTDTFKFQEKDPELRKKVFFIRKYDHLSTYGVDISVRCILELSRRECFKDMEFYVYGGGPWFNKLLAPLEQFDNVHLNHHYLTQGEIAEVHKQTGVALFPTRYDTQGVSMCEAASSGLPVVSTYRKSVADFLPEECGLLCDGENYRDYADKLEQLYNDPDLFLESSRKHSEMAAARCDYGHTIAREIELLSAPHAKVPIKQITQVDQPVLSICVPVYNLSWHLRHVLDSLLGHEKANKLEVIVVNDGSKDDTADVARELMEQYNDPDHPVVSLIDKENGGHGSTVNAALAVARGKYFKIVDCDDRVFKPDFVKLIDILEESSDDIVLCNYSEDRMSDGRLILAEFYNAMVPGVSYRFEDLCYEGYGFKKYGPILHTGYFNTEMLKKTDFKLDEHCFYVDMEFDLYAVVNAETVSYYPLNVYQYAVGREDQSVSKKSFMKNFKNHETVIFTMLDYMEAHPEISDLKTDYINNKLITPLLKMQYQILIDWMQDAEEFNKFDEKMKKYPHMYKRRRSYVNDKIRFNRRTSGKFIKNKKLTKTGINVYRKFVP